MPVKKKKGTDEERRDRSTLAFAILGILLLLLLLLACLRVFSSSSSTPMTLKDAIAYLRIIQTAQAQEGFAYPDDRYSYSYFSSVNDVESQKSLTYVKDPFKIKYAYSSSTESHVDQYSYETSSYFLQHDDEAKAPVAYEAVSSFLTGDDGYGLYHSYDSQAELLNELNWLTELEKKQEEITSMSLGGDPHGNVYIALTGEDLLRGTGTTQLKKFTIDYRDYLLKTYQDEESSDSLSLSYALSFALS